MGRLDALLNNRSHRFMGVDIGEGRIKLLELDGGPGTMRVLSYANEPLPPNALNDHEMADPEAVAQAVAQALERSGTRTRNAAIAVSGPGVISKIIDMPHDLNDDDMEQQIHLDAERYIPHPIEEVSLDFRVLERDPENPEVNKVLLVACRRDHIELRIAALEMARLNVKLVDVEELALRNACVLLTENTPGLKDQRLVAIFNVGAHRTHLVMRDANQSVYTRELGFGTQSLVDELIATHELDSADRLFSQLRTGELEDNTISVEVNDFAQRAAGQIERALAFYASTVAQSEPVDRIVIVGEAVLFPGFEAAVQACLAQPVTAGNPLAGMLASSAARRNQAEFDGPSLMTAAGIAMRAVR